MDYRIFGALVALKNTGAITKEEFIEKWRRNQKWMGISVDPTTKYLMGPYISPGFLEKLKWRFRIGRFAK